MQLRQPAGPRIASGRINGVLLRLAYLTVANTFAVLRLLPMSDRAKDAEILALRHQITVLQRHLVSKTVTFTPVDRAFLAALLEPLPRAVLRQLRLVVQPDTCVPQLSVDSGHMVG
jgi:putative transposase